MKKIISILMAAALCLSLVACSSSKIKSVAATDSEKQAVIDAATEFFTGEAYVTASALYEEWSGEKAAEPEILAAYTVKCDDVEGFAVDLILCRAKANYAWVSFMGDPVSNDTVLFLKDNNTGKIYDSFTHDEIIYNNILPFETAEEVALAYFNTHMFRQGTDEPYFWSETEQNTAFKGSDLKDIQKALDEALAEFALNPPTFEKIPDNQLVSDAIVKFFEEDTYKMPLHFLKKPQEIHQESLKCLQHIHLNTATSKALLQTMCCAM